MILVKFKQSKQTVENLLFECSFSDIEAMNYESNTNSMTYELRRFNDALSRALQ